MQNFTPRGSKKEEVFLAGPQSRWKEFTFALGVMREFIYGFRKLHFVGPCITVFGSARFPETHPYYKQAVEVGAGIVQLGFTVMTGGGPGIMEAANRGAKNAGGRSIGCNIVLPKEQKPNPYLDLWINIDYFFVRKTLLSKYSYGFVVMPGGYGTLDEFFEAITLIETGKFKKFPVVLMGKKYHVALYEHIQRLVKERTIGQDDLNLFLFTDSVAEAMEHIRSHTAQGFGLKRKTQMRPYSILGESSLKK
jgi:uncharacterized protein (TIGR00730 family)